MKRTALNRSTPLRSASKLVRAPMKRITRRDLFKPLAEQKHPKHRQPKNRASKTDRAYTAWIHAQPCCAPERCRSHDIEQHHKREGAGIGQRSHDRDSIALCHAHHQALHGLSGCFSGWTRQHVRDFVNAEIESCHARYHRARAEMDGGEACEVF